MRGDLPRLQDYLIHLKEAIERIGQYINDLDEIGFLDNPLIQDAVLRNMEVMGEAANCISKRHPEYADQHPGIPWQIIYAMRNRISHAYHKVDLEVVWKTIECDLPRIYEEIVQLLHDHLPLWTVGTDDAPELDDDYFERASEYDGDRLIQSGRQSDGN